MSVPVTCFVIRSIQENQSITIQFRIISTIGHQGCRILAQEEGLYFEKTQYAMLAAALQFCPLYVFNQEIIHRMLSHAYVGASTNSDMCDYFGIDLNHHRADSDSNACAEILI